LVPTASLRTFQEEATAAALTGSLTGTSVFDVNVSELQWDRYVSAAPLVLVGDDATIEVNVLDPENLADGFTIDLFDNATLSGTFNFSFPNSEAGDWNTADFISSGGQLTFGGEAPGIPGDYSGNGLVEQADLDLVLGNWGAEAGDVPATWVNDLPTGFVDQAELDKVLGNWGAQGALGNAAGVPEPSTIAMLLVVAGLGLGAGLARKR
jgi:hypothetical protein